MSDYLSGSITFTGLGSGTDFESMIDKLMDLESTHQKQLEVWQAGWEYKVDALEALNDSLVSLKTTLSGMDDMNSFMSKISSSSDEVVLTATATSEAEASSHSVDVVSLAKNSIWVNETGVPSKDTAILSNMREGEFAHFNISYDNPNDDQEAANIEIVVDHKTTLSNLVTAINSSSENNGVKASIINDGDSYYLQVRGMDLGSNADLEIVTPFFGALGGFSEVQSNADAKLRVDGWPEEDYIHSSSNTVTDAIDGVVLTLKDTGVSQVTTSLNTEEIVENVQTVVTKINEVRTLAMSLTKIEKSTKSGFDETTNSETKKTTKKYNLVKESVQGSAMTGNYAVQLTMSKLKSMTSSIAPGFVYYDAETGIGDAYTSFSQVGIKSDADESSETYGLLIFDETVLETALLSNANGVAELFAADGIGGSIVDSGNFSYKSSIHGVTKAGVYDLSYRIDSQGNIVDAYLGGIKANVNNDDKTITAMDGDARGLEVQVNDAAPGGPYTGQVRLKEGKIPEIEDLVSDLTNTDTGTLNIVTDNYETIIANIEDKILFEETRIENRRSVLTQKYARLEALLGNYDKLSSSISSQISQLSSS